MKSFDIDQSDQEALAEGLQLQQAKHEANLQSIFTAELEKAQYALDGLEDEVNDKDEAAQSVWNSLHEAAERRRNLIRRNGWLMNGDLVKRQKNLLYLVFGAGASLLIDSVLFSGISDLMLRMLGIKGFFLALGKPLIPLGIMGLEFLVSNKLHDARNQPNENPNKQAEVAMWKKMATALAIAVPALGIATFLAFLEMDSLSDLGGIMTLLVLGLAVLSPLPHLAVLHTAYRWPEAKVLLDFRRQRRVLRKLNLTYEKTVGEVLKAWRRYRRSSHTFKEKFNTKPAPPHWSVFLKELVLERLGIDLSDPPDDGESEVSDDMPTPLILNGQVTN